MIHYNSLKMVLVAPQKAANSQRVSGLLFIHTPPGHHKSRISGFSDQRIFPVETGPVLRVEHGQTVHEKRDVDDPAELRAEGLDLGVERFGGGVCQPRLEIVYNRGVVVLEGLKDAVELVVAEGLYIVVPPGEVEPCHLGLGLAVENLHEAQ